jgi:hypothetical protein
MRTERRRSRFTGGTYPWIVESTAMVNRYYFYCVDENFGPFFLKFCSYFPYNAKLCINGNEYLKRQLAKCGAAFEALDNGVKSCADPKLMQRVCDELSAGKIDRLLRKTPRRPQCCRSSVSERTRSFKESTELSWMDGAIRGRTLTARYAGRLNLGVELARAFRCSPAFLSSRSPKRLTNRSATRDSEFTMSGSPPVPTRLKMIGYRAVRRSGHT